MPSFFTRARALLRLLETCPSINTVLVRMPPCEGGAHHTNSRPCCTGVAEINWRTVYLHVVIRPASLDIGGRFAHTCRSLPCEDLFTCVKSSQGHSHSIHHLSKTAMGDMLFRAQRPQ